MNNKKKDVDEQIGKEKPKEKLIHHILTDNTLIALLIVFFIFLYAGIRFKNDTIFSGSFFFLFAGLIFVMFLVILVITIISFIIKNRK